VNEIDLNNDLIKTLPERNKCILRRLFILLKRVVFNSSRNKMGIHNLALIFGPTLLKTPTGRNHELLSDIPLVNSVASCLITQCDDLFKDTKLRRYYLALYRADFDHSPKTDGELELKKGDLVWVMERDKSGWWKAEVREKVGFVPSTYISPISNKS